MRVIVALALAAIALGACGVGSAGTSSGTSLKISFWANGLDAGGRKVWTLRCNPPGGTHWGPGYACRRLASGGIRLFAPVPDDAICTEIYGGPEVARVVGTYAGKRIWATFSRTNGCHIGRWNRLSPWLLPAGGA